MKMRKRLHRILAGALAVIVLGTSSPVTSAAELGESRRQMDENMTEDIELLNTDTPEPGENEDPEQKTDVPEGGEASEGNPANPEEGKPSDENPANPEEGKPSDENPANPEEGKPSDENPANPEEGKPSDENPANPEEGKPSDENPANPEDGEPSGEETEDTETMQSHALYGLIFVDFDENGEQGEDETGIEGVTVRAYAEGEDEAAASAETDEEGYYRLEGLESGRYTLELDVDDEQSMAYDFAKTGEAMEWESELPSGEDDWELRFCVEELTEDRTLDIGLFLSEDLFADMFMTAEAEPVADGKTVTSSQLKYNGYNVYWQHDNSKNLAKGKYYDYHIRTVNDGNNTGVWLFCLNEHIDAGGKGYTKHSNTIPSWAAYEKNDSATLSYIKKVAYYSRYWPGWSFQQENGKILCHLAGQMLIWDALEPDEGTHRAYIKTSSGYEELDLKEWRQKITTQVNNHDTLPSFCGQTVTINKSESTTHTFTDNNKVLSEYEVTEKGEGIESATIDGNKLTVVMRTKKEYSNQSYLVKLKRKSSKVNGKEIENATYTKDLEGKDKDRQPVMIWGSSEVSGRIRVNYVSESQVLITKLDDSGKAVSGVRFRWGYAKNALTNLTGYTNANGQVSLTAKSPSTIYVQEESVPSNIVLSTEIQPVTVTEKQTATVTFTNVKKHSVTLRKVDSETEKPLAGARFEYYDKNAPDAKYYGVTDGTGSFTSGESFPTGTTVVMKELSPAPGYLWPTEGKQTQEKVISLDDSNNVFTFVNEPYGILFRIVKKNKYTKEPIAGMTFRVGTDPALKDPSRYRDLVTGTDGRTEDSWWAFGSELYYQEIDGPDNIELDTTIHKNTQKVAVGVFPTENPVIEVEVYNEDKIPVCIKKTGSDGRPLDKVRFSLQRYSETSKRWVTVETLTTSGGTVTSKTLFSRKDIANGYVRLKEEGNIPGYSKLEEPIVIPAELAETTGVAAVVPVVNPKIPTYFSVWKYDTVTREPLEGAEFIITDAAGNVVQRLATDSTGMARTTNLYADTLYYIEETKVPRGYEKYGIFTKKQSFIIQKDGKTVNGETGDVLGAAGDYSYRFDVPNNPVYNRIEVIKKDDSERPIPGIEFTIYQDGSVVDTLITDDMGYAISRNLVWADGFIFEIRETYCPPEYLPAKGIRGEPRVEFTVGQPYNCGTVEDWEWLYDSEKKILTYKVTNTRQLGRVTVKKVDSEKPDLTIEGAVFELFNLYTGESFGTATTDKDGIATFTELPFAETASGSTRGYYRVKEIEPGEGYKLPKIPYKDFALSKDDPEPTFVFENPPVKGSVEIKKVDDTDRNQTLKGARFAIYRAEDYEAAVAGGEKPTVLRSASTNMDGIASFTGLRYGKYIIKETEAPLGYYIDEETGGNKDYWDAELKAYRVQVTKDGETIPLTVTNKKARFQIEVIKYGGTIDNKLANVSFNICKKDGTLVDTITTGKDGTVTSKEYFIEELGEGAYVVEKGIVPGYKQNTTHYLIDFASAKPTVRADLKKVTLYIENEKEGQKLKLQKLDEDGNGVAADFRISAVIQRTNGTTATTISPSYNTTAENPVIDLQSFLEAINRAYSPGAIVPFTTISIEEISVKDPYTGLPCYQVMEEVATLSYYIPSQSLSVMGLPENVRYDADTLTLTIVNKKIPITINVRKLESDGGTDKPLAGAEFSVKPNNPYNSAEAQTFTGTTGEDGTLVFENLPYAESYTVTETKAPDGYTGKWLISEEGKWYLKDASQTYPLQYFTKTEESGKVTAYYQSTKFWNYKLPKLRIQKTGPDGEPLNAAFHLTCSAFVNDGVQDIFTDKENGGYAEVDLGNFLYTNDATAFNTLYIEETAVEEGYVLFDKVIPVDLEWSPGSSSLTVSQTEPMQGVTVTTEEDGTVTITIEDKREPIPARILLKKVDKETRQPLAGVEFSVTTDDGYSQTFVTTGNENGDWLEMPYASVYTIRETKALSGYKLLEDAVTLPIGDFTPVEDSEGNISYYEYNGTLELENEKEYEVYLYKTDSFENPAEASFEVEGWCDSNSSAKYNWTVQTVDGKADFTPVLEEARKVYPYGTWHLNLTETDTEDGLQLFKYPIAQIYFRPAEISSDSVTFVEVGIKGYGSAVSDMVFETKGSCVSAHFTVRNNNIPITLTLQKTASQSEDMLAGAVYEITPEGKKPIEITTSGKAGGDAVLLPYATSYRVVEKSAPDGYVRDPKVYTYDISEFETTKDSDGVTITAYNKSVAYTNDPVKGKIQITKYDEAEPVGGDKSKLAGAVFGIYKGTLPESGTDSEKYEAVVHGSGYTKVEEVTIGTDGTGVSGELPYGDYIIAELTPPSGYELSHRLEQKSISRNGGTVYVSFPNRKLEGTLTVFKYEEGTSPNKPLANARFQVIDLTTGKVVGEELVTGIDGTAFIRLPYGNYSLREVEAPSGYVTVSGDWEQEIQLGDGGVRKEIPNKKAKYGFRLLKVNGDGEYLAGARFGVYAKGVNPYEDDTVEPICTFETDASGSKFVSLENAGDYDIYELKAPEGYVTTEDLIDSIHVDDTTPVAEVRAVNSRQNMTIQIYKVDEDGSEIKLKGAGFEIYSEYSGNPVVTVWTDENGEASAEVPAGNIRYTVKEIQAPDGYVLDGTVREVTVTHTEEADGTVTYEAEPLTITNKKTGDRTGVIRIIKVDSETGKRLPGAVFNIVPDSTPDAAGYTVTTNSEGVAEQANVPYGTYRISEAAAPDGYELDERTYTRTLSADTPGATVEIEINNTPSRGGFRVKKVDAENHSKVLPGAEFAVFASRDDAENYNPNRPGSITPLGTRSTGPDGIAVFEGLRYGSYYVRETKAPDGYSLSDEMKEVTVDKDSLTSESKVILFEDEEGYGIIRVRKEDEDTGEVLQGAVFRVEKLEDGSPVESSGKDYTTGESGYFETEKLAPGTYRITEQTPPAGHLLSNPQYQDVTLTADSWKDTYTVVFRNPKLSASVKVTKRDEDGRPLANAQFGIYARNGQNEAVGEKLDTLITGLDGTAVSGRLFAGKYILVEERFPDGYRHSDHNPIDSYLVDIDKTTVTGTQNTIVLERTIVNTPVTGDLKIVKTDSVTDERLNGAEFTVYRSDNTVYGKAVTGSVDGEDGIAVFKDVPYGMYYVRETGVPEGYRDTGYYKAFRITDSEPSATLELKAENTPVVGTVGLIKVDAEAPNIGVPGAVYGIYRELNPDGTVKEDSWLGEDYNLTTAGTRVEEYTDSETGEVIPAHYAPEEVVSKELSYGTYYVKEISSPKEYVLNDTVYTARIQEEHAHILITAEDEKLTGKVTITKVDEDNKPLKDAEFTIYTAEEYASLDPDDDTTGIRIRSGKDGIASCDGLTLGVEYVIRETMAPAGYELDENVYRFTPGADDSEFSHTVTNKKKDEIVVLKVDDRGNPLWGVVFGLYSAGADGISQTGDDYLIDTFGTVNSDGYSRYESAGLYGKFYVKELQEPYGGYILSDEIVEFELTEDVRSHEFTFENEPYPARLNIRKVDEKGEPLTGAEFELYDRQYVWDEENEVEVLQDMLIETISMKNISEAQITGLYADRLYVIRETKAPDGYAPVSDTEFVMSTEGGPVTGTDGTVYYEGTVTVENVPISGRIQIQKEVSNDTGVETEISLAGAKFEIRDKNGTLMDTLTTGGDGITPSSKELGEGVYTIKETKAPDGTLLNAAVGTVNINGEKADGIYTYTHTNPIDGKPIHIEKVDENGMGLPGAVFEIIRLSDMSVLETLTTGNDGRATSGKLPYGAYMVRETASAPGHTFGGVTWENVVIDAESDETKLTVRMENPSDGNGPGVRVVKYDRNNVEVTLPGAEFALYDRWTLDEDGNPDVTGQTPLRSGLITNEKGWLDIESLAKGQYVLVETKAPNDYVLDDTPHLFTLGEDQSVALYIDNEAPGGRIRFTKTGDVLSGTEQDGSYAGLVKLLWSGAPVEGAEIGVYTMKALTWKNVDYKAGELITTVKSGEVSEYLPVGDYTWKEISAPSSYLIDTTGYSVTVKDETGPAVVEPAQAGLKDIHGQVMLELYKKFSNQDALMPAELEAKYSEVKFGVYTDERISSGEGFLDRDTLVAVFGVDKDGRSVWSGQKLPEGRYYVTELETASGYMLDEEIYGFTVSYENQDCTIAISSEDEPIINQEKYGLIRLQKVGNAFTAVDTVDGPSGVKVNQPVYTETELEGAELEIRATASVTIGGKTYRPGEVVDTLVSGSNGADVSIELPLGTYDLVETKAPEGYILDSTPRGVTLTSPENEHTVVIEEVHFANTKATVTPQVYKRFFGLSAEESKELYSKVCFGIYAAEDIRGQSEEAVLSQNMLVQIISLDENGMNSTPYYLPAGHYYLKELSTAEGYALDEKEYPFEVKKDSAGDIVIDGVGADNPIINYPEDGEPFAFRKIDEKGQPLEGATFVLYRCTLNDAAHEHDTLAGSAESCWKEIEGMAPKTSGADGIVDFGKLPDGDYQLVETGAPEGYEKPSGQWHIQVDTAAVDHITITMKGEDAPPAFMKSGSDTYQYQLPNNRSRDLPLAGGPGVIPYMGGGGILLSAAALLFKKRRKEEPEEEK